MRGSAPHDASLIVRRIAPALDHLVTRPAHLIQSINEGSDFPLGEMSVHINRADLVGILDTVRNKVLDWAIEMEKAGISGEGLTITAQEQNKAQAASTTYNIGSIGTFTGVLGEANTTGSITSGGVSVSQVGEHTKYLRLNQGALIEAGADGEALGEAIRGMETEVAQPEPDRGKLHAFAKEVRAALSGAAGTLMASGFGGPLRGFWRVVRWPACRQSSIDARTAAKASS